MVSLAKSLALVGLMATLSACSNGGNLSLEPGARKVVSQGSPFVHLTSGSEAMVVEQGKTSTTGVHGWVSLQPITSQQMQSTNGTKMVLNKTSL